MSNLDKIFKAYDIRGIYSKEINEKVAYKVGQAVAEFLKAKKLVVGRDNRPSSKDLFKALCKGICEQGVNVINIGLATTPMLYFSAIKRKTKGGIMVTASHNPLKCNGFKIIKKDAMPVGEDSGLKKIKRLVEKDKFKSKNSGKIEKENIIDNYIENILKHSNLKEIRPFKITVNTNDGVAELIISKFFKRISAQKAISRKADLGIILDKDGDRILFVDEKEKKIDTDLIAVALIHYFFKNTGKILYTVVSSHSAKEEIKKTNNIPVCSEVGHSFIKNRMKKEKIIFGYEPSGHYYLADNYFIESPFIILLKILEILSKTKMTLSELIKPFRKYYQERINLKNIQNVEGSTSNIMKGLEKKYKKVGKISRLDGLTIEFNDWWFNLRASNTESIIRLTIEAGSRERLKEKKKELLKSIPFSF